MYGFRKMRELNYSPIKRSKFLSFGIISLALRTWILLTILARVLTVIKNYFRMEKIT